MNAEPTIIPTFLTPFAGFLLNYLSSIFFLFLRVQRILYTL